MRRFLAITVLAFGYFVRLEQYVSSYANTSVPQETAVENLPSLSQVSTNATFTSPPTCLNQSRVPPRIRTRGLHIIRIHNDDHSSDPTKSFKILCFAVTHSGYHATRIQSILDTWGPKCDKFLVVSNVTDSAVGAVRLPREGTPFAVEDDSNATDQPYSYSHLWIRIQETLVYIANSHENFLRDYDFFFKVDDDTFCIIENLRTFLLNQTRSSRKQGRVSYTNHTDEEPRIWGRQFVWRQNPQDADFLRRAKHQRRGNQQTLREGRDQNVSDFDRMVQVMQQHVGRNDTPQQWMFPAGGAGYVMNRAFVRNFAAAIQRFPTGYLPYKVPEDVAMGATMQLLMVGESSAALQVESDGNLLFHPELPQKMFNLPPTVSYLQDYHYPRDSLRQGPGCCDPFSITFHHVSPKHMRYFYKQLYPTLDGSPDTNCTT